MKRFFPCCAVFLLTLFAGCEPFNFTEHFEEQTGRAEAVGWAFSDSNLTEPVIKPDGTVAVAPGDSFIAVTLNNPRNYALSPDLVNEGPPASGVCTALQEDSRRVLVAIRGAALHDEYRLTLKLTSPDGSREFEPYPLPVIRCLSFNTDLDYLRINGGAAALEPGFDPAITSYTARVFDAEGFTLSAAAADPQAELYLDGTPLEGGVEITRTLEAGDNAFTLNVRAENGVSEKAYTLNAKWFADGGGELVSIAEISDYLADAAGGATAANPLPLQVSIALADGGWEALLEAIAAAGKYVALDLAECAMSGTEFDPYTAALGGAEYIVSLVLPDAATSIKAGGRDPSFMHFSGLAVVYGGNITDIGKNAFGMDPDAGPKGLTNLTEANFPEAIVIGKYAFGGCTALETVNLPKVEFIDEYAFGGCTALETVDLPKAESIGTGAFLNCGSLETVDLPKAESIGDGAFGDCGSLERVNLPEATSIGDGAFLNCISLETVDLPSATAIGNSAFYGCTALETVSLPNATDIGSYAFSGCTALETVSLPNVTDIGNFAFYGCIKLETVSLPNATDIGEVAFGSCTALKTASFPNATTIGNSAFGSCTALETVSGENITGIDHYAFNGCTALETVSFPNARSIGNSAFRDCTALETISLPNATVIDGYAFYGCTSLKTVSLPNATVIGQNAFNGCNALTAITIGGNLDVSDSGIPNGFETRYNDVYNKNAGIYKYSDVPYGVWQWDRYDSY